MVAEPVMRFTLAALTPGVFSKVRWIRLLQPAQVIPETGMVQVSVVAVLIVAYQARVSE